MNPKLESKYLFLEKSRNKLLNSLEEIDEETLNTIPSEGKWSIGQIAAHLLHVEQLTIGYIQKKLQKEEEHQTSSLKHMVNSVLLKLALTSGMKFKAPQVAADVPETVSLSSLRTQWDDTRYKLEDLLTALPPQMLDKCLFRHPYAGMLTISQTLTFMQDHFNHHLPQINHLKQQLTK
ncbi:DinB family protein [Pontibacter sp. KCTC 32443]|uniref:DinB family protein n=1 Tax=Pontibacter TaxID=323449 RepID=UPI00164E3712|nr:MULTISPECIES: DinB family protein [Pontibacter]MBC5774913.1 DinB family protein [Pontibacter sp. KCTC 32443]